MKPNLKNIATKGVAIGRASKGCLPLIDEVLDDVWSDEGGKGKPTRKTLRTIVRYAIAIGLSILAQKTGIAF